MFKASSLLRGRSLQIIFPHNSVSYFHQPKQFSTIINNANEFILSRRKLNVREYCTTPNDKTNEKKNNGDDQDKTESFLLQNNNQQQNEQNNDQKINEETNKNSNSNQHHHYNEIPDENKIDYKKVTPIAISGFLMSLATSAVLPFAPVITINLGISQAGYGLVLASSALTRLFINIPVGFLAERYGRRPLLIIGPLLTSIGTGGFGIAQTLGHLISLRSLSGIGGAMEMTSAQLYLSDISNAHNRARTMAPMNMASAAGNILGPFLGGLLASAVNVQFAFTVFIFAIVASASNYFLVPETKSLNKINQIVGKDSKNHTIRGEVKSTFNQWKLLFKIKDLRAVFYLQTSFWISLSYCVFTLLPLTCNSLGMSYVDISSLYVTYFLVSILFTKISANLSDKFGRKLTLVPSCTIIAISAMLLPFTHDYYSLAAMMILWGAASGLYGANTAAYVTDVVTECTKAQGLVILRSAGDVGTILGTTFISLNALSPNASMYACFFSAFLISAAGSNLAFRANESKICNPLPFWVPFRSKAKQPPPPSSSPSSPSPPPGSQSHPLPSDHKMKQDHVNSIDPKIINDNSNDPFKKE